MRGVLTKILAFACLGAASAQGAEQADDAPDQQITAEEILANPLGDEAYQQSARCLSPGKYRRVEIMNNQVLIFHGRGDEKWINILPNRCLGLQGDMIPQFEKRGMRLCERDQFSGQPRFRLDAPSMPCSLGRFHPTNPDNLAAMRDALEANHRTKTVNRTVRSAGREAETGKPESDNGG